LENINTLRNNKKIFCYCYKFIKLRSV